MQENKFPIFKNKDHTLSLRMQKLISHLETLWKNPYKPSPEMLKRIIEFLSQLPESYQALGVTKIAEYLASGMGLHFIDLIAKFQEKAKLEGIDEEEIVATLEGAIVDFFPEMMGISKQILTRSLDDLVTLSNITFSLHTLSQADTAEDAQSWIYELPTLYLRHLSQEHLITNIQVQLTVTQTATTTEYSGFASWKSSLPNPVTISTTQQKGFTIA
jgi:hypothetical protein